MTSPRPRSTALTWAFLWSFTAYLIPLIHAHGGMILGVLLWKELTGDRLTEEPLWAAADATLAVGLQLVMGGFFYWVFRGRARLRAWGIMAVFPALAFIFNPVYQVYVPAQFLIEPEARQASGDWPVACELKDTYLANTRTGVASALERASQAWLVQSRDASPAMLTMPGCAILEVGRPANIQGGTVHFALPGGRMLYQLWDKKTGKTRLVFFDPSHGRQSPITSESKDIRSAILSADGKEVVWLHRLRRLDRRFVGYEIRRLNIETNQVTAQPIARMKPAGLDLLSEDADGRHLLIARSGGELIGVDRAGQVVRGPEKIVGFSLAGGNLRVLPQGWVVWDGYRDKGRYRLTWALNGASGMHEVPKGRGITDVSVSPSGRLIAISVTTRLNIGNIRDAVYVLRTLDGKEIFRRFLPSYTRSPVAFLGDQFFAYSFLEGREGRVRVLRVPEKTGAD